MRIYISGPITNDPNYITKFWLAELRLEKLYPKAQIFNPASAHEKMPGWMEHRHYMELCKIELSWCDTMYQLKGWEISKGSRMEWEWAEEWGLTIMEEKDGIERTDNKDMRIVQGAISCGITRSNNGEHKRHRQDESIHKPGR